MKAIMTCSRLVRASADDSVNRAGKWATSRQCKGKVTALRVRTTHERGEVIACYCTKHIPRGNDSIALVPVNATPAEIKEELQRVEAFDAAFQARIRNQQGE